MRSKSDMREKMREDGKEKNFSEYEKNMDEIIVKGAKENNLKKTPLLVGNPPFNPKMMHFLFKNP